MLFCLLNLFICYHSIYYMVNNDEYENSRISRREEAPSMFHKYSKISVARLDQSHQYRPQCPSHVLLSFMLPSKTSFRSILLCSTSKSALCLRLSCKDSHHHHHHHHHQQQQQQLSSSLTDSWHARTIHFYVSSAILLIFSQSLGFLLLFMSLLHFQLGLFGAFYHSVYHRIKWAQYQ